MSTIAVSAMLAGGTAHSFLGEDVVDGSLTGADITSRARVLRATI